MLIGEFTHALDDKNRLSLPSKFRKELGKEVVVTPGLDGCLFVFSASAWKSVVEKFSKTSMLRSDSRNFGRYLLGGAASVSVDSIGRILLPDYLKDRAELLDKVVILGVENRLELWNEQNWIKCKASFEKQASDMAEKLGDIGVL
ncbi:MAG: division/cell wall cluster transcriptional repressor MraZ [Candidatus Taylorbacteria bacterium RIFCSPLOWO2_12_FULL_47_20]|uniref:Transcriptional regulator MraZ n=2 Tax=Candidatus Tayloriibacteriota TaxID=1817919 RepID=A0A1G2PA46_9BACT|nr:MAG: division/cell wall cluster transcriptional repressor MraZ [Candidatus Taylorbacteria bacterium RIFCSPLOWO2_02_FULL_46_40]OHA45190.1 MAG: division/cell wall cluster transcriptional repressor MraZ [Candidatus Taylorbacteria bacterium RIFCSPLOWO2_12_FULL_47_20]